MAIESDERTLPCRDRSVPYGDDAALAAFREDGYVVVTGVLSPAEVDAALDELWTSPNLLGKFDRDDPTTWSDPTWPQQDGGRNFLSSRDAHADASNWDVSSSPRQYRLQKLLWRREDLLASGPGRWGVMRPSGVEPRWRTEAGWLHWDHNPWTKPGFSHVQAIVCLTDATPTSGGFACVPGFHRQFRKWGEDHPVGTLFVDGKAIDDSYGDGQPFPVPADDPCQRDVVRVLAPAGSMILWDSRTPHQNVPNVDDRAFRVVFYCNMVVATPERREEQRRLLAMRRILMDLEGEPGPCFPHNLSPLGRQVHGWTDANVPLSDALEEFGIHDRDTFREAAMLVREAGAAEEAGDVAGAIRKHRAALRAFPDIEAWHGVIFG